MKHAAEGFEGVCSNTPKNDMQMFCAFRREDAPSRGLTAGFGIGPGVSPPLAIGVYSGTDLAITMVKLQAFVLREAIGKRLGSNC